MKRNLIWMLGAFILVSALLVGATIKARQNALYQLSRYPKTPAFERYLLSISPQRSVHIQSAGFYFKIDSSESRSFEKMRQIRIFSDGSAGKGLLAVNVWDASSNRGWSSLLSSNQFSLVKNLVRQLPPSSPPTERDDLLIVYYNAAQGMQIRLYDKHHPPAQINKIQEIIAHEPNNKLKSSNSQNAVD